MKNLSKLLLAAGFVAAVTSASPASADEPLLSPKAKANRIVVVQGTTEDQLYRGTEHRQRGWFAVPKMVASEGIKDRDLAHDLPLYTGKNPSRDFRPGQSDVQIAPLK